MKHLWSTLRSIVYATGFLGFWGWLAWGARALDKYIPVQYPAWLRVPGIILILAGAMLAAHTVGLFVVLGQGTPAPFDPPKRFVPRGPYRFVRNPMYVGGISVLIGLSLQAHSPATTLMALAVFILVHTFVLVFEEPDLRKRFGQEYESYCKTVPRWVPRLTPPRLPT